MERTLKLFLLLILVIGFLVANHFSGFFLWQVILANKATLTFAFFCVLVWEIFRTVVGKS